MKPPSQEQLRDIPEMLRADPRWVGWKLTSPKNPGDKPRKLPIDPKTGRSASSTNPATWSTFVEALKIAASRGLAGIGFVFTGSGLAGIDLDGCRDAITGLIAPWAQKIVDRFASYTEVSPSKTGIHIIVRGKLPSRGRKRGSIEVYDTGRYFTVTGALVPGTRSEVAERQQELESFYGELNGDGASKEDGKARAEGDSDTDSALIRRILASKRGEKFRALWEGRFDSYPSQSEADLALCSMLAWWTDGDAVHVDRLFRQSGLYREKWDELHGEATYGAMTIKKALSSGRGTRRRATRGSNPDAEHPLTDTGNSERLVDQFGNDLRYCYPWKKWLAYGSGRWRVDQESKAMACSKEVARSLLMEAARCADRKVRGQIIDWALASEKVERRKAMVDLARSERGIPIRPDRLDQHPFKLNVPNGTLDLRTFELGGHRREDYISKLCPTRYTPDAACPRWHIFLNRIMPDDDGRAYVKRLAGHALTGDVSEQMLAIGTGEGANGKSVLMRTLLDTLSQDYAIQVAPDLLLDKGYRNHPTEIADLFGVRLAVGIESAQGRALDEALVKHLTGEDLIRARRMREDFWQFQPSHKLVLVTNHLPKITLGDYAMRRRIHVVRFEVTIPEKERDKRLLSKLRAEREGILAWMVEGCREWSEQGLCPPEQVLLQPQETAVSRSPVEDFLDMCVIHRPGERTTSSVLYAAFLAWCMEVDRPVQTQQEFGTKLGSLGIGRKKSGGIMVYLDVALTTPPPAGGEDQGQQGPLSALILSDAPHEGVNARSGPSRPQSSPTGTEREGQAGAQSVGNHEQTSASSSTPSQEVLFDDAPAWHDDGTEVGRRG